MFEIVRKSLLLIEPELVGIKEYRKKILFLCLSVTAANLLGFLAYKYGKENGSLGPYLCSLILILSANIFYSFKFTLLMTGRIKDSNPSLSNFKVIGICILCLFPWIGLYLMILLSFKEKVLEGFYKKHILLFLLASTLIFAPYRYFQKESLKNSSALKHAHHLLYDNSMYSIRYLLHTALELDHLGRFSSCDLEKPVVIHDRPIKWDCFVIEASDQLENSSPRSISFVIISVAKEAERLFKLKSELSGELDPKHLSPLIALKLIDSQITFFNLMQQRATALSFSSPFLPYLRGNIEGALFFLAEEFVQYRFEKVLQERMLSLSNSLTKRYQEKDSKWSEPERLFYLKKATEQKLKLEKMGKKSFLRW